MADTSVSRNRARWLLYQPYKWLIFAPLLVISTCFFVGLGVLVILLFDDRMANRTTGAWWSRFNCFMTPIRVTVVGRENIQDEQSYIVVSNHQSLYDIFILFGWLKMDLKWVIKKELRSFPVFGYAAEKGGNILIDRSNPKEAYESLKRAKEKCTGGTSLIILPEGTRSRTGELGEFKKGAFWLAQNLDLPILPVTILSTRNILPPDTLDLFPGRVVMKVHEPIDVKRYGEGSLDVLITDVRDVIEQGLDD